MTDSDLRGCCSWFPAVQVPQPAGMEALGQNLGAGLEVAVILLTFTLAIFVLLCFAVRALMILRKLPVPIDPVDMAKPKGFRALMLGSAALLAPLVATYFVSLPGPDAESALLTAYGLEVALAAVLWLVLELFYRVRARSAGRRR